MPALLASSDVRMSMPHYSQIANIFARGEIRKSGNALSVGNPHTACMDDDADKNGGPNHLKAWMRYRKVNGARLAEMLDITPGMVSELVNSKRALSAKWLRRIAPVLGTTPGHLLDHDPNELPNDILEIWINASDEDRAKLLRVAQAMTERNGTDG